ncbi:MAG: hypothetical protein RLN70_07240 [Rhodospirillaceae bacterium]
MSVTCLVSTAAARTAVLSFDHNNDLDSRPIEHISQTRDSLEPWGHHNGRYDWNHYWTLDPPDIYSPPRPWRWSPFTMQLRRFPDAVPYHHGGMFSSWTYDYRATPAMLVDLFPEHVNRRMTEDMREANFTAYESALNASVGEAVRWTDGTLKGSVTTVRDGWSGRRYCRQFRQDIYIDERPYQAMGTVCRDRAGNWHIAPNQ